MPPRAHYVLGVALALALAAAGGACGAGGPQCAPGTVAFEGRCVASAEVCGPGTRFVAGECTPACAPGEYLADGTCQPIPACAPGTAFDETQGECVTGVGACAAGTHLEGHACLPDVDCGPGTHAEGIECLPGSPTPDVLEAAEPDGVAEFTLPAAGEVVRLGGVIDLPAGSTPDWDTFRFHAGAGTFLRLRASSDGAPLPALMVFSTEEDGAGQRRYARYAFDTTRGVAEREVYLPRTADYEIWVSDHAHLLDEVFGVGVVPVGGTDFGYLVEVLNLGAPVPTPAGALPATHAGNHANGKLAFFRVGGLADGELVALSSAGTPVADVESDTYKVLMVFDAATALLGERVTSRTYADADLLLRGAAGGEYLVVEDYVVAFGARTEFALSARPITVTECAGASCNSGQVEGAPGALLRYQLAAGDLLVLAVYLTDGADAMANTLFDGALAPVAPERIIDASGVGGGPYYATEDTAVYAWLRAAFGTGPVEYVAEAGVVATPLVEAGRDYQALPVYEFPPYTFAPAAVQHYVGTSGQVVFFSSFAAQPPGLWLAPRQTLLTPGFELVGPVINLDSWAFPDSPITPLFAYLREDGHYLHYVSDEYSDPTGGTVDFSVRTRSTAHLGAAAVDAPLVTTYQTLAGSLAFYSYSAARYQHAEIEVTPLTGFRPEVWVMNFGSAEFEWVSYRWQADPDATQLGLVASEAATANGAAVTLAYTSPYDGLSLIMVENADGGGTLLDAYTLRVTVPPPPSNDRCSAALPLTLDGGGDATVSASTTGAGSEVDAAVCGLLPMEGPDVFYRLDLASADTVAATVTADHAGALYLVSDCAAMAASCRTGGQGTSSRSLTYTVPDGAAGTYYLGVDSYGVGGTFSLQVSVR